MILRPKLIFFAAATVITLHVFVGAQVITQSADSAAARYQDQVNGVTADRAVDIALQKNAEVVAIRSEASAGEALLRQARFRANPSLEVTGARQTNGSDNNVMVQGEVPLELGGRRDARIRVAERELDIRRQAVAERERQLAFEVRSKFGEALAAILKLQFTEEMLGATIANYDLVAAQVAEGRRPPLEQNLELVELNRTRTIRESAESTVETRMFELRNLLGMEPTEPLTLKGAFDDLLAAVPPQSIATQQALQTRPDLAGARAVELLATARAAQARAEGRIDADVMVGYQRAKSGFPLLGVDEHSPRLLPIESKFHFFTFGVRLNLPVLNQNKGMIAAAQFEAEAARTRREFGELTVKREIAVAYARHTRALRAMEIYRVGVRDQARDNLEVVRQTYELGSKTLLDYMAEHHRFIETENGFIDAQLEAYMARLEVLRATNSRELTIK
jgi:cobalt-zinc-cadmium efflux system outer membrane protein